MLTLTALADVSSLSVYLFVYSCALAELYGRFYWVYYSRISSQGGASCLSGSAIGRRRHLCRRCSPILLSSVNYNYKL